MNDDVANKKQSAFSFDQEIPSLLEPFQQKEKELGDSSPDLIPLKMQMIDAFIEQGNHYQAYKDFMSLIDMIYSTDSSDLPASQDLEKLCGQAVIVDKNIPGTEIAVRLEEILFLKIISQRAKKLGRSSPEVVSLQIQLIICYLKKGDLDNVYKYIKKITKIIFVDEKLNTPPSIYFKEITDLAAAIDKHTSDKVVVNNPRYLYLINMLSFLYFEIACMYENGSGIEQDYKEFFKWCRKSAEMGFIIAQLELGYFYKEGKEIVQDYKEAFKWYRRAAEQGDASAQLELGYLYVAGNGTAKDYKEAFKCYRKAAEQGNISAKAELGVLYSHGCGVEQNDHEAIKWFLIAAEAGDTYAAFNLARHYIFGEGVEQNDIQAYKWLSISAREGHEQPQETKQRLEEEMTPVQVAEAQELARKWIEKWKVKFKPIYQRH